MNAYTLLNKSTGKKLKHPVVGLWFTPDLQEAIDALKDCHQYLDAVGLGHMKDEFIVADAETEEPTAYQALPIT